MLTLKTYQTQALDSLRHFLQAARRGGRLDTAWQQEQQRQQPGGAAPQDSRAAPPYRSQPFGDTPCVCLRIPTGGGKTLLASHAIPLLAQHWRQADFPVALWLVPSTTIRDQTLLALQTPGHAYRAALEAAYGQALAVLDLDAAPTIAPQDLGRKAIVLVATMQSFRVRQTAGATSTPSAKPSTRTLRTCAAGPMPTWAGWKPSAPPMWPRRKHRAAAS